MVFCLVSRCASAPSTLVTHRWLLSSVFLKNFCVGVDSRMQICLASLCVIGVPASSCRFVGCFKLSLGIAYAGWPLLVLCVCAFPLLRFFFVFLLFFALSASLLPFSPLLSFSLSLSISFVPSVFPSCFSLSLLPFPLLGLARSASAVHECITDSHLVVSCLWLKKKGPSGTYTRKGLGSLSFKVALAWIVRFQVQGDYSSVGGSVAVRA